MALVHFMPASFPTWEEIKAARYDLLAHDITKAMLCRYLMNMATFIKTVSPIDTLES